MSDKMNINLNGHELKLSIQDFNDGKKRFFDPETEEGKKIELAMHVDTSAEYATNAQEYFRRAMIGEESSRSEFRQLLGVKDRVKLGGIDMSKLSVKPGDCEPNFDDTTLKQKEYEVKPLMLATRFCVRSLEVAFVSDQLSKGSNNFNQSFAFMNFFYSELERWVRYQMELLTWKGDLATDGVDGLEVTLEADPTVLKPIAANGGVASAINSTNVVAKLQQARDAVDVAVLDTEGFCYRVSSNVYNALADAVSENKMSGLYFVDKVELNFQGIPIKKIRGASANVIIATYDQNLVNVQDLMDEELGFNVVDFMKTTLSRSIGVRVDFKFQPDFVNGNEIYFHKF